MALADSPMLEMNISGPTKYRVLAKNTAKLMTLFVLKNLWILREWLSNMRAQG